MEHLGSKCAPCMVCGGLDIVVKKAVGDVVCTSCGCVLVDHIIDHQPEWKKIAGDDTKIGSADAFARCSRMSKTQVLHEVHTTFLQGGGDIQRKELSRIHKSLELSRKDRKYFGCLEHLQRLCHRMHAQKNAEVSK